MRTAAHVMLLGAPMMALLFVLFPRMAPLWGLPVDKTSARTGLSAQMSIGSMASLVLDGGVALRVRLTAASLQRRRSCTFAARCSRPSMGANGLPVATRGAPSPVGPRHGRQPAGAGRALGYELIAGAAPANLAADPGRRPSPPSCPMAAAR